MKRWMKRTLLLSLAGAAAAATGCERGTRLEVQTFRLEHLEAHEAGSLIDPYVYSDRDGAPGMVSMADGAITVRETADNLERIARVLAEFDQPQPDLRLHFQLIEADGFTGADERIADVEAELRKIFQFGGYRLAGEAFIATADGSEIEQDVRGTDGTYSIQGVVYEMSPGVIRLQEVKLWTPDGPSLQTSVNIRPGQTIVLGSSPKEGSTATLLLTVRAEEADGPA